jgi:hypothetical protein
MKLSEMNKGLDQPKKQKEKVWQDEEGQGDGNKAKNWYAVDAAAGKTPTYRWGTGKPMSGDGYEDHILKSD